jgi:hypothetical protein
VEETFQVWDMENSNFHYDGAASPLCSRLPQTMSFCIRPSLLKDTCLDSSLDSVLEKYLSDSSVLSLSGLNPANWHPTCSVSSDNE